MDQEDTLDFQALRARFQEEENLLKQPKPKPALPDKPKVIPPPQSPTHYVPAGARPSLLTSISQSLESKSMTAPRVVFKEDKKEAKKPLIPTVLKTKKSKEKAPKGSKETPEDEPTEPKPKKKLPLIPGGSKDGTMELVPATPPPKTTSQKKKGFLAFRKSKNLDVPEDPILDSPSSDLLGPAPLIPAPTDFSDVPPEPEFAAPKVLVPNPPTVPDPGAVVDPDFPNLDISNIPESETHFQIDTPAMPLFRPASLDDLNQGPPSATPTPPPGRAFTRPPPLVVPTPPPEPPEPEAEAENVSAAAESVFEAPSSSADSESIPSSPKSPISPILALTRATEMSPPKKMSPCDQRIFNALEKARRKISAHKDTNTTPSRSSSITPPPEDLPPSPESLPALPPIDYEGNALPPKPANGLHHGEVSPVLEGIAEEATDIIPEQMVVPPLPPKKVLPNSESLGPPPVKPSRPFSLNLNRFNPPPPMEDNEIQAGPGREFSETDTTDVPEFEDVTSDAHSHSDWGGNGDYVGPDSPDGQGYSNGMIPPGPEVHIAPTDTVLIPETSIPVSHETHPRAGLEADVGNGFYESTENVYEFVTASGGKKKGKTDIGKKRKGPPKNPYAEAQQETCLQNEEKIKTGRFGKNDKKPAADGPDEKELKKREKQRLEREKKELKERQEREKKEQKEREKKENEMKKKFKITGQEDAMYQAKVTVTTKGRKNDLPVTNGDIVSIIRTTNCPKGKWLARDGSSNNYGYISVDHVELDIKEMLELGKKAAITRMSSNTLEEEASGAGNRASNHYPTSPESYTDDSEEWTGDDDDTLSPSPIHVQPTALINHSRTQSMPDMGNKDVNSNHQHSRSDIIDDGTHIQARHEALQKLATFFHATKPVEPAASSEPEMSPVSVKEEAEEALAGSTEETEFDPPEMLILPPPDLYADLIVE